MAGQGDQHDAAVAEEVALAVDRVRRRRLLPLGGDIARRFRARRARRFDLPGVNDAGRALEESVAAAMVGMQVRAYDHVDIVTFEADARRVR